MIQELFTEKYRPSSLEQLILPERIQKLIADGELHQNFLFYGPPGMGKTTLAKVLASKYPTLYINVSDESSVEVIRERIKTWCATCSVIDGAEKIKVVILDEMDGASEQFYKALRATIETYARLARFIGTCNYINKVPEPIQSRFTLVNFDFVNKTEEREVMQKIAKRIYAILKTHNIQIEKPALIEFVKRNFPDMRKMLNKIQTWTIAGVKRVELKDIKELNYSFSDIFKLLTQNYNSYENYKFLVTNYSSKVDEVLAALGNEFPEYLRENHPEQLNKLPAIIIEVAQHQAQRAHVIDPVITMLSCVYKIQTILNS